MKQEVTGLMQEMEKIINLYHIGFLICLALSMIFLLVTVFLFFKFDIRNIIDRSHLPEFWEDILRKVYVQE